MVEKNKFYRASLVAHCEESADVGAMGSILGPGKSHMCGAAKPLHYTSIDINKEPRNCSY